MSEKKEKKRKHRPRSIFWRIAILMLPVVLLADAGVLFAGYKLTYDASYQSAHEKIRNGSKLLTENMEYFDLTNEEEQISSVEAISNYCNYLGLTYCYVIEVDPDRHWIRYLTIGFGADSDEKARKERYPGVKVTDEEEQGVVDQGMIEALENGDSEGVEYHLNNQFGDTLIYYARRSEYYDFKKRESVPTERDELIGVEVSISTMMESFKQRYNTIAALTLLLTVVLVFSVAFVMYRKISIPAQRISRQMSSFVAEQGESEKSFEKLPVHGEDEFADMSRSFNTMVENINEYLSSIKKLNQEKHTREVELDIAGKIQLGLLRKPHREGDGYMIDAKMIPARDVGGDLYDYLRFEDGRIFFSVADVSGKGITASLFMSRAVTLLHIYAKMGYSPRKILEEYNNTLAEQNSGGLFITTFVAVYDQKNGELTYSNAGHNIPYVLSDRLIPLDQADGIAAGVFPGEEYQEATLQLSDGDMVFLYTDGVNEAQNDKEEFFTTEALEEELKKHLGKEKGDVLRAVQNRVIDFIGSAEPSDDMTMLVFQTKMTQAFQREITVPADVQELPAILAPLREIPGLSDDPLMCLEVMAEEIFVNICSYAYPEGPGNVDLVVETKDGKVILTFTDDGVPFDPTNEIQDIDEYDHLNSVGGVGRFITFEMADECHYENRDGKNILRLVKNIQENA